MARITILITLLLQTIVINSISFRSAVPFIDNYTEKDFKVSCNNQDIIQDKQGLLYFANDYGILEFDGYHWDIIQIPSNRSNVQSLAINDRNQLFVGAHGDIGYLTCNEFNQLAYKSLVNKIESRYQIFGDVLNTFYLNNKVYFHSKDAIFIYENDTIKTITMTGGIMAAFKVNDKIIIQSERMLYQLTPDGNQTILTSLLPEDVQIKLIFPFRENALLVGTAQHGLYTIENGVLKPFSITPSIDFADEKITTGKMSRNGDIVLGTTNNGIYFINQQGVITSHLNRENGLQNNSVKDLFIDKDNNLWCANKTGIDMIEIASPFTRILLENASSPAVYDAAIYNNNLYLATNEGLLYTSTASLDNIHQKTSKFSRIRSLENTIWSAKEYDGSLLIAHENGFTEVRNGEITSNIKANGGWKIEPIPNKPDYYLAGTYTGFLLFKRVNHKFEMVSSITGFSETCRVFSFDEDGNIWMAHGYKGIYKLQLSNDLTHFNSIKFYDNKKGLPQDFYNGLIKLKNQILFTTQYGLYKYDSLKDTIIKDGNFTSQTSLPIQYNITQEDSDKNIWIISNENSGIIHWNPDGTHTFEKKPFLKLNSYFIPGFEFIYFVNQSSSLIGTKTGVVYFDGTKNTQISEPLNTLIREIRTVDKDKTILYNDRISSLCNTKSSQSPTFTYAQNNLQFTFTSNSFESIQSIAFQYYLEGFDKEWSEWSTICYKQYTNLPEGTYTFRVKARNTYNTISNETTYHFTISPPWYRSILAYIVYILLTMCAIWLIIQARTKQLRIKQERFMKEQLQERSLERAAFKEEKLKDELMAKYQELSGLAMKVIYKNEKLSELKEKVLALKVSPPESRVRRVDGLVDFIDSELNEDNWEAFSVRFDLAHNNFISRLKTEYPDLTYGDLKTCAYLRMNLSTKEIARLQNLTVRGVETARLRIRKRMNLNASQHLNDIIITY